MLGLASDLVLPLLPRAEHRWRTVLTVAFHLLAGLLAAVLLFGVVPGAVVLVAASAAGRAESVSGVPVGPLSPVQVLLAVLVAAGCFVGVWALGRLAAAVTARLLGPTPGDRLEVALTRLEAESEHTRLARELHDGIGHALTIIGVQAAAGRRTLAHDPQRAGAALSTIEATSREALEELDGMLGLLRDGEASRSPEPDLSRLETLLVAYTSVGMDLELESRLDGPLPRLVSTTAYRVIAEALANAQRYGGPGRVRLAVQQTRDRLEIRVTNPLPGRAVPRVGSGRGLAGVAERVALFGGSVEAGADGAEHGSGPPGQPDGGPASGRDGAALTAEASPPSAWTLQAIIPIGSARD
jgi:signal transduction histidine kinase